MITYGTFKQKGTNRWDYGRVDHFGKFQLVGPSRIEQERLQNNPMAKIGPAPKSGPGLYASAEKCAAGFAEWAEDKITVDGLNFMRVPCFVTQMQTFRCAMLDGVPFIALDEKFLKKETVIEVILRCPRIEVFEEANDEEAKHKMHV